MDFHFQQLQPGPQGSNNQTGNASLAKSSNGGYNNNSFPPQPSGGGDGGSKGPRAQIVAVWPKYQNQNAINQFIDWVRSTSISINIEPDLSSAPYLRFSTTSVGNLMSLNGKLPSIQDGQNSDLPVLISQTDKYNEGKFSDYVSKNINTLVENGNILNLSAIKNKLYSEVKYPQSTEFILFLCAIKCYELKIQIEKLFFCNNEISNTYGLRNIAAYFPQLTTVYLAENPLSNSPNLLSLFKNIDPNRPPIQVDFTITDPIGTKSDSGSSSNRGWGRGIVQDPPSPFSVTIHQIKSKPEDIVPSFRPKLCLDHFIPVTINPNESIVHALLLAFFDCGWKDIRGIGKFYSKTAVFSVTIDICAEKSSLAKDFGSCSRDHFLQNPLKQAFIGPGKIVKGHELFGTGFYAHPTAFSYSVLSNVMCGVVVHGAFQKYTDSKDNRVYCFDRSFLIGLAECGAFITNDHIFIRAPKIPGTE